MVINVEDYPGCDYTSEEGKERLKAVAFRANLVDPDKWTFVFRYKGRQVGYMITRRVFDSELGVLKPH
jgi:hypothetical protein